jgi:hypothetical protein
MTSTTARVSLTRALCALTLAIFATPAGAVVLDSSYFITLSGSELGSGNGTLDLILLTESSGGAANSGGTFNGDNANIGMPTGNGNTTALESYITSIGDLRDFYILNFPDGNGGSTISQMVIFVDVNETGGSQDISLDTLNIVQDFSAGFGDDRDNPFSTDISSALQNGTNAGYSGGTLLAGLDASHILDYQNNGAGHADVAIFTGINPFSNAFSDSTRILFHWASSGHDNGGESIYLSGEFAHYDLPDGPSTPEPSSVVLAALGLLGLVVWGRSRKRSA